MSATPDPAHLPLAVDGNGELHDTRAIESAPGSLVPPLRCAECGSALEAVRAHPRRDRAIIIHIAAHYRLAPGATHRIGCSWHTMQVPRGPARRPAGSPVSPLMYSLVVPGRADRQTPVWRSRSYRHQRLPALNSAAKVAEILDRDGNNAAQIRLDYRGRLIRWHDFLFPCADAERLAQFLRHGRQSHPLAVVGRLGDPAAPRSGHTHLAVLTDPLASTVQPSCGPRIVVRTTNRQLIEGDHTDPLVIALGWWQHRKPGPGHVDREVALWINRGWQISPCGP